MFPLFDRDGDFLGSLELITHFNSIANKLKDEGVEAVVLVDKSYKNQLTHPLTKSFIGDYYVANSNASKELTAYIEKIGVDEIVAYHSEHFVTDDGNYLRINHTLFEDDSRPMAYLLMFKKISQIDIKSIENEAHFVDLFLLFALSIFGFSLSLFARKEQKQLQRNEQKQSYIMLFVGTFLFMLVLFYLILDTYKTKEHREFLVNYNKNIQKDYYIISEKFEIIAQTMFETILNRADIHSLMQKAYGKEKDTARAQLYELLKREYEKYTNYDVRQLHFHLKNNESFLRFHRPQKYGDDLTSVRDSVAFVNANNRAVKGFEEGRIYNGFRYVFPLNTESQEHLGSVEVSFSAHAIANDFVLAHQAKVGFLVSKKQVESKLFNEERPNYKQSEFEDFYYDVLIKNMFEKSFTDIDVVQISQEKRNFISKNLNFRT